MPGADKAYNRADQSADHTDTDADEHVERDPALVVVVEIAEMEGDAEDQCVDEVKHRGKNRQQEAFAAENRVILNIECKTIKEVEKKNNRCEQHGEIYDAMMNWFESSAGGVDTVQKEVQRQKSLDQVVQCLHDQQMRIRMWDQIAYHKPGNDIHEHDRYRCPEQGIKRSSPQKVEHLVPLLLEIKKNAEQTGENICFDVNSNVHIRAS